MVTIPKIKITTTGNRILSFGLTRMQFPIRLAYSMTINKSKGQSLQFIGINLVEIFSHIELFRAICANQVKVVLSDTIIRMAYVRTLFLRRCLIIDKLSSTKLLFSLYFIYINCDICFFFCQLLHV